jgi:hypothetical protein
VRDSFFLSGEEEPLPSCVFPDDSEDGITGWNGVKADSLTWTYASQIRFTYKGVDLVLTFGTGLSSGDWDAASARSSATSKAPG